MILPACSDIAFAKDLHFLALDFDVAATVPAVDHRIAIGDAHLAAVSAIEQSTGADGDNGATLRLFLG